MSGATQGRNSYFIVSLVDQLTISSYLSWIYLCIAGQSVTLAQGWRSGLCYRNLSGSPWLGVILVSKEDRS